MTGFVNWTRVTNNDYWHVTSEGHTYVYAFWIADTAPGNDIRILKRRGSRHHDWFIHADTADEILTGTCPPGILVSENHPRVFAEVGGRFVLKPTLAGVLLDTSGYIYASQDRTDYFDCRYWHLNWRGKRFVRTLSRLYERPAHLVTFLNTDPMSSHDSEAADQATVDPASESTPKEAS